MAGRKQEGRQSTSQVRGRPFLSSSYLSSGSLPPILTAVPSSTLLTTGHWQAVPGETLRLYKTLSSFTSLGQYSFPHQGPEMSPLLLEALLYPQSQRALCWIVALSPFPLHSSLSASLTLLPNFL